MRFKRIGGAVAVLTAGALALAGCGGDSGDGSTTDTATDGSTGGASTGIVTVRGNEPQNPLIPSNTNEVGGGNIVDLLFAGLVTLSPEGEASNEVAESIESDDYINWTITLNDGWTFTDGEAVTSSSFVDAWKSGAYDLNTYFFSHIAGYDEDAETELTGLTVVDDTTFTVELDEANPEFPLLLAYSAFYPLPSGAIEDKAAYGELPVGNGPYMFASDDAWQHNVEVALVPNPDYEGPRKAQNGGVTFKFIESLEAAYNDLLAGNLDITDQIPESALATFQDELGDRSVNQAAAIFQSFTINGGDEHFGFDEEGRLRRAALSHAIDREEITEAIFEGTRIPARDFTSPVVVGFDDAIPGSDVLDFDADKAQELWAEAEAISPYTDTFTIAYNADGGHEAWVDAITNQLRNNLGIEAEGKPYPTFAELRTDVTNRTITGAFRTGWQGDVPAQSNFLGPLYQTGAGSNDGDYANPEFDSLIREGQALLATDAEAAAAKFNEAQELLFVDLPAIPLWYQAVAGGWSEHVENVVFAWNSVPALYQVTKN